jgi:hypothetical protein
MDNTDFFTNTYVTSSGRQNYLRMYHLEDPLFTGFTFDIDYATSPLFYTIYKYDFSKVDGLGNKIEEALVEMYSKYMGEDKGYDILPVLSKSVLDGVKLGFGLQQNVYMDMPLYGATEYIYMVDKRNGGNDQNDAIYDSNNRFLESGSNSNTFKSIKLGDSVKSIVNESDRKWAERNINQNKNQVEECQKILDNSTVRQEHDQNLLDMENAWKECENNSTYPVEIGGKEIKYSEGELMQKIKEMENLNADFEQFKREIKEWVNGKLSSYQNRGSNIYYTNECMQKIAKMNSDEPITKSNYETIAKKIESNLGTEFRTKYLYSGDESYAKKFNALYGEMFDNSKGFLCLVSGQVCVSQDKIISIFRRRLEQFELLDTNGNKESFKGNIILADGNAINYEGSKELPEWVSLFYDPASWFTGEGNIKNEYNMSRRVMSYVCDDSSFDDFVTEDSDKNEEMKGVYEDALENLRIGLYGMSNGEVCDSSNPEPGSPYANYLEAKERCENDDFTQAERLKGIAESGNAELNTLLGLDKDEESQMVSDDNYNETIKKDVSPSDKSGGETIITPQTVLDMLGFISGMKRLTMNYPYIIQGITGLDAAYNNHYGIKDPYLGSGDNKITLTCLESLDLRVSSMFNRYFNAVYDRQYRRERVPINLRRFNCSVYIHDIRNFVSNIRSESTYNRILELTDMYYSVVEFRFYDCEIVPEETGNIFNDISNEAPSEMKKTNFTFTYGNCVVNFVPNSEVASH